MLQDNSNLSDWCNIRQAANHLGISVSFIREAVRLKKIPFSRIGTKLLRFRRSELDLWAGAKGSDLEVTGVEREG